MPLWLTRHTHCVPHTMQTQLRPAQTANISYEGQPYWFAFQRPGRLDPPPPLDEGPYMHHPWFGGYPAYLSPASGSHGTNPQIPYRAHEAEGLKSQATDHGQFPEGHLGSSRLIAQFAPRAPSVTRRVGGSDASRIQKVPLQSATGKNQDGGSKRANAESELRASKPYPAARHLAGGEENAGMNCNANMQPPTIFAPEPPPPALRVVREQRTPDKKGKHQPTTHAIPTGQPWLPAAFLSDRSRTLLGTHSER